MHDVADQCNRPGPDTYIPIRLFFDGPRPTIEEASDSQFHKWSNRLKNEAAWIERIYLRARWRSRNEAAHNPSSLHYVQWLMTQWIKQYQSKDEIT